VYFKETFKGAGVMISKNLQNNRGVLTRAPSFRKYFLEVKKEKISVDEFEEIFNALKEKCCLKEKIDETAFLTLATVGGSLMRKSIRVVDADIDILLQHAILSRLFIDEIGKNMDIGDKKEKFKEYIKRGGNIAYKETVEPYCCYNFFPNPQLAIAHYHSLKNLLDSVPSEFERYEYEQIKDSELLAKIENILGKNIAELNRASYRYQKYAIGLPNERFRYVGSERTDKGQRIAVKRILYWEAPIEEKIKTIEERFFKSQKIITKIKREKNEFAILTEEGEMLKNMISKIKIYEFGKFLRSLHDNGIGHDKPEEIQVEEAADKTEFVIASHEDVWIADKPLSDDERKFGLKRIVDLLKNLENGEALIREFFEGYGKEFIELEKQVQVGQ